MPSKKQIEDAARRTVEERDSALLSMDEQKIREYFRKYNHSEMPEDMALFWMAVHKSRIACRSLPMEARRESKQWLLDRGSKPLDGGEISMEETSL